MEKAGHNTRKDIRFHLKPLMESYEKRELIDTNFARTLRINAGERRFGVFSQVGKEYGWVNQEGGGLSLYSSRVHGNQLKLEGVFNASSWQKIRKMMNCYSDSTCGLCPSCRSSQSKRVPMVHQGRNQKLHENFIARWKRLARITNLNKAFENGVFNSAQYSYMHSLHYKLLEKFIPSEDWGHQYEKPFNIAKYRRQQAQSKRKLTPALEEAYNVTKSNAERFIPCREAADDEIKNSFKEGRSFIDAEHYFVSASLPKDFEALFTLQLDWVSSKSRLTSGSTAHKRSLIILKELNKAQEKKKFDLDRFLRSKLKSLIKEVMLSELGNGVSYEAIIHSFGKYRMPDFHMLVCTEGKHSNSDTRTGEFYRVTLSEDRMLKIYRQILNNFINFFKDFSGLFRESAFKRDAKDWKASLKTAQQVVNSPIPSVNHKPIKVEIASNLDNACRYLRRKMNNKIVRLQSLPNGQVLITEKDGLAFYITYPESLRRLLHDAQYDGSTQVSGNGAYARNSRHQKSSHAVEEHHQEREEERGSSTIWGMRHYICENRPIVAGDIPSRFEIFEDELVTAPQVLVKVLLTRRVPLPPVCRQSGGKRVSCGSKTIPDSLA
jgi:hypothetical protein